MLRLPEAWVWDFWLVDDGQHYHLFFLHAPRTLPHPDDRHYQASIGHAISDDLTNWHRVTDALVRSDPPNFDDQATWTGSVVRHPDGTWYMFYTGATHTPAGNVQRIGYATSTDLMTWEKSPDNPVVAADARWYEKLADRQWRDEAFRDPWVMPNPDGNGWHMLITARSNHGPADDRGVVGHATSPDLRHWTLQPPVSQPGQGFGQLEVMQYVEINERKFLLFSCLGADTSLERQATGTTGGVWLAQADGPLGPYDLEHAHQLTDSSLYVGRLIHDRNTMQWHMLTFHHEDPHRRFIGEIGDPVPFKVPVSTDAVDLARSEHHL